MVQRTQPGLEAGAQLQTMNAMNRARKRNRDGSARAGFTLIEMLLVIIIGAILLSFAIPSFNRVTASRNAQNARDAVVWMAARARARAIERGQVHLLEVSPANDRAWIVRRNTGTALASDTLETLDLVAVYNATISTGTNANIRLCYNARGYAFSTCSGALTADEVVTFTHVSRTAQARMKVLGHIERL
jgi:prepilin-type N-terminal cleavage/methylation domain-containing protein